MMDHPRDFTKEQLELGANTLHSDYLDTSNPLRLKAFFKYCDAANLARKGIADLSVEDSRMRNAAVALFESTRRRAEEEAINVLAGRSLFVSLIESSLHSDPRE